MTRKWEGDIRPQRTDGSVVFLVGTRNPSLIFEDRVDAVEFSAQLVRDSDGIGVHFQGNGKLGKDDLRRLYELIEQTELESRIDSTS